MVLFTDGAVHDNNGGLEVKPVSFTGGMLKEEVRAKRSSYKHLGFVPSLLIGKGKNADCFDDEWELSGKKVGEKSKTGPAVAKMKAEDEQLLYQTVLSSLKECCMNGGVRCLYKGKRVLFLPFILLVISAAK